MEPAAAAWVPFNFQLANWTALFPGEIYGSWMQTRAPDNSSGSGRQLFEYYAAATQHCPIEEEAQDQSFEVALDLHNLEIDNNAICVFEKVARNFEADIRRTKEKIHRYPECIRDLGDYYTVPRIVAIGPYHHGKQPLGKAEEVKWVAAYHCIVESGCSPQAMYDAVASAADDNARTLYDKDVMAGIGYDDFRVMMFFDACFLVQYIVWFTGLENETDPLSWHNFLHLNRSGINHDVWLLENQLPWSVVEAVMRLRHVNLQEYVKAWRGTLQDRRPLIEKPFVWDDTYDPPHLLGLLRHYAVGRSEKIVDRDLSKDVNKLNSLSFSASAMELAEIGITFRANETAELVDMGLKKYVLFAELSLAPLSLNHARASRLVNMAAFEICTVPSFIDAKVEDSAVCSYLLLLCMLVHREEDVHELRRQGILQGGAGLTDKQALKFFASLQRLPDGQSCTRTMIEIENYRFHKKMQTKVYKKRKTIFKVLSITVAAITIFGTLLSISAQLSNVSKG